MKKLLIPCCLVLLAGCVDKDYDKEIDMNVTIAENGITLPVGETDKFTLSKLIDTDDNLTYIIHSGFISGYQNRYGDNLKPPTNVYHRMTA